LEAPEPETASRTGGVERVAAFILIAGLFGVEAAYFGGPGSRLQRLAAIYWIGCSAAVVLSAWLFSFSTILERAFWSAPGRLWYLAAFLLPPVLVLVDGGGTYFTPVDSEGLQQVAAGVDLMRHDPGLGVFRTAYGTYLARQYELNCLPALLFGPTLWTLRVGNSIFYLGSYLFFLNALASYLRHRRAPAPLFLAGYCGMMIALAEDTLLIARKFEQTTMPIGATLFFLGALLLFLVRRTPARLLWVTWVLGFLTECYTPALGSWVLAMGVLLWLAWKGRQRILAVPMAYGLAALCVAFLITRDGNAKFLAEKFSMAIVPLKPSDLVLRYAQGLRALVGFDRPLLPAPFAMALAAGLVLSWRYRSFLLPLACLWAVAIAFMSLSFIGSNLNFPGHDLHRALIILPPLALGVVLLLARYLGEDGNPEQNRRLLTFLLGLSMAYAAYAGTSTVLLVRTFQGHDMKDDYDEVCENMNRLVRSPATVHPMRVFFVPPLDAGFGRAIWFFDPNGVLFAGPPPPGERVPGTYIFSYRVKDARDRFDDAVVPSRHPRPFIQVEDECGPQTTLMR
jgi:hypothetical protein